jgi:MFS family permease
MNTQASPSTPATPQAAPSPAEAVSEASLEGQRNFRNVQIDAVGVGVANTAAQYLSPFLTLLNASNTQVGLLSSMAGLTGLVLAIPAGRFLQNRRNIIPWYALSRLLYIASYTLIGILPFFIPPKATVAAILVIVALASLPQTMLNVCFSVVMNAVAGPTGRFRLMSWRWSIMGFTTGLSAFIAGQLLDRMAFPLNYQIMFIVLSLGGLVSFYFSIHLHIPDNPSPPPKTVARVSDQIRQMLRQVKEQPAFVSFSWKRVMYLFGMWTGLPLFTLYYVRDLNASNSWLGSIATAQTMVLMIGYFGWGRVSRRFGSRSVLLLSTLALAVYPFGVAVTQRFDLLIILAGLSAIMQAGMELTFFDELMKTVPVESSAFFVSIAQTMSYAVNMAAPLIGTFLADQIGIANALLVSGVLRLVGFILFLRK